MTATNSVAILESEALTQHKRAFYLTSLYQSFKAIKTMAVQIERCLKLKQCRFIVDVDRPSITPLMGQANSILHDFIPFTDTEIIVVSQSDSVYADYPYQWRLKG